ncbi:MAG: putative ribosome biogenesis GTPase RsgA [Chlamydiae bacterium]|nr:putative ribosome biogenesis GTPase RsgA [Chlamydiota bacterium]
MHDKEELSRKEHRMERKIATRKDRSKFKKTDRKKHAQQLQEERERKLAKKNLAQGRVLSISPEGITIDSDGKQILCVLSGILKKEVSHIKNLITVGDIVLFEPDKKAIAHIEERYSVLARKEHLRQRQQQLIAANIDQVLITVSVVEPPLKPALIDRYIIATLKGNMQPVIVVNKIDLLDSKDPFFDKFVQIYRSLDIPVITLSAKSHKNIAALKKQMQERSSVFSGQSGVGKSSLINAVTGLTLPTGDLAKKTRKGTHITRAAQLIPLTFGGFCIDTPGIRSFGLWDLQKEDLETYFPEITEIAHHCRFPDCSHTHEPHCTVQAAVEQGEISKLRFDSYLKLLKEIK